MRRLLVFLVLPLMACPAEVVLGRYRLNGPLDAGTPLDAGANDAAVAFDAGVPDGGADGGLVDSGVPFASLEVSLTGAVVLEQGETTTWSLQLHNPGTLTALRARAVITKPPDFAFLGSTGCALSATEATCDLGDVDAGATVTATLDLNANGEYGWNSFDVTTTFLDGGTQLLNAGIAETPPGGVAVNVLPQVLDVTGCRGMNIRAFSQCVPGSTTIERYELFVDGGLTDDAGYDGLWGQSNHQRNVAFRFRDIATGQLQGGFVGASVSAQCFEGVIDVGGVHYVGAWRACVP
jgi:hypothetical protein